MLIFAVITFVFVNSIEANILTPNIAYGKNKTSSPSLSNSISHKTKLPAVRITSPIRGQDVPVGKNLVVSGISAANSAKRFAIAYPYKLAQYHNFNNLE